jgi:hypothetical protein
MARLPLKQEIFGVRFARIAVDIISGFITTARGNKVMLVIQDYYTKYGQCIPLPDKTAPTCADALLHHWILPFGTPMLLHSDQGREFENKIWFELCQLLNIKKTRTNPYRPQSDGQVERWNKTLVSQLSKMVNKSRDDWDIQSAFVVHAYNTTEHAVTGYSPNYLLFAEEIVMPLDIQFGLIGGGQDDMCETVFVHAARQNLRKAYDIVASNMSKGAIRQKLGFDSRGVSMPMFNVGDKVLRFHAPLTQLGKLGGKWDGPYVVATVISENTVFLRGTKGKLFKSNVARLRRWRGRESTILDSAHDEKQPVIESSLTAGWGGYRE